jgi:hypothetical protein
LFGGRETPRKKEERTVSLEEAATERRGVKEDAMPSHNTNETEAFGLVIWLKSSEKRSQNDKEPFQQSRQRAEQVPLPIVTTEFSRKERRPAIIPFQIGVSRK